MAGVASIGRGGGSARGVSTTTLTVSERPSLVAVIAAVPSARAVTTPSPDTLATDSLFDVHVVVRPGNGLLSDARGVADS